MRRTLLGTANQDKAAPVSSERRLLHPPPDPKQEKESERVALLVTTGSGSSRKDRATLWAAERNSPLCARPGGPCTDRPWGGEAGPLACLPDAVLAEAVIVAEDDDFARHGGTDAEAVLDLEGHGGGRCRGGDDTRKRTHHQRESELCINLDTECDENRVLVPALGMFQTRSSCDGGRRSVHWPWWHHGLGHQMSIAPSSCNNQNCLQILLNVP